MWERVAPVYMASPTASICETYRHSEQKPARKFCGSKEDKNSETHSGMPEKGETGCVLGAGGENGGKNRLRADVRGQHRMQHELGIDRPCPGSHRDEKAPGHAVFARPGDK